MLVSVPDTQSSDMGKMICFMPDTDIVYLNRMHCGMWKVRVVGGVCSNFHEKGLEYSICHSDVAG